MMMFKGWNCSFHITKKVNVIRLTRELCGHEYKDCHYIYNPRRSNYCHKTLWPILISPSFSHRPNTSHCCVSSSRISSLAPNSPFLMMRSNGSAWRYNGPLFASLASPWADFFLRDNNFRMPFPHWNCCKAKLDIVGRAWEANELSIVTYGHWHWPKEFVKTGVSRACCQDLRLLSYPELTIRSCIFTLLVFHQSADCSTDQQIQGAANTITVPSTALYCQKPSCTFYPELWPTCILTSSTHWPEENESGNVAAWTNARIGNNLNFEQSPTPAQDPEMFLGEWHPCGDFCMLNNWIKSNWHLILFSQESMSNFFESKVFS